MVVLIVLCLGVDFCAVSTLCVFSYFSSVWVAEWPPFEKMAAQYVFLV